MKVAMLRRGHPAGLDRPPVRPPRLVDLAELVVDHLAAGRCLRQAPPVGQA
jgi:hypothetical protein